MQQKKVIKHLIDIGHVGELARLLSVFSPRINEPLGKSEIVELVQNTAGLGYRYPRSIPTLAFALYIGLVQQKRGLFTLTSIGKIFTAHYGHSLIDLSPYQGKLVLSLILDDKYLNLILSFIMRHLREAGNKRLQLRARKFEDDQMVVTKVLQQIGALELHDEFLIISPDFESLLQSSIIHFASLTEDELWNRLNNQRLRGKEVEEFILKEEKKRLIRLGRKDLADFVVRVSTNDVSAGYDIQSYEVDSTPRFIEVKSSVGNKIYFEWSTNEREQAKAKSIKYWIYFLSMSYTLPKNFVPIAVIQNPIAHINAGDLIESPTNFRVNDPLSRIIKPYSSSRVEVPLLLWPKDFSKRNL